MRLATARPPCSRATPSGPRSPRRRGVAAGAGAVSVLSRVVVLMAAAPAASDGELVIALQPAEVEGGEDGQDRQQQHTVRGGLGEVARLLSEAQVVGPGH